MTTAMHIGTEVADYITAVRAQLGDLPADEREEVLDDLEAHLAEVAAESDAPLAQRLGPPEAYAAELRASAGYGPTDTTADRWPRATARATLAFRSATSFLPEARPGWWLLRGPIAVVAGTAFYQLDNVYDLRAPGPYGLAAMVVVAALSIPLSIAIGRRAAAGRDKVLSIVMNLAVVLCVALAIGHLHDANGTQIVYVESTSEFLAAPDGRPIFNIYPFAADGAPLENVLLYDQDGIPLENLAPGTRSGVPVVRSSTIRNLYPQSVSIGAVGESRPDQRPTIAVPQAPPTTATPTTAPPAP